MPETDPPLRRVGLFGGTFDPPHVGHLVTAVNVRHALELDVVVLMVANVPWQKEGSRDHHAGERPARHGRSGGARRAGLVAGRHEIDHGGPSYTADTLAVLAAAVPRRRALHDRRRRCRGRTADVDALGGGRRALAGWSSSIARVSRSTLDGGIEWIRVEVPRLEVSSTDLRARFTDGRPLDYLVTQPVLDVIRARGLYGASR